VEVPVFGVPLDEALKRRPSPPGAPVGVPLVVYHCIQHLTNIGGILFRQLLFLAALIHIPLCALALELEGIFRISGSQAIVDALRKSYDKGEDVDFSLIENPHDVSGLLKLYLRDVSFLLLLRLSSRTAASRACDTIRPVPYRHRLSTYALCTFCG
jgi:RalA-binding protein 1